MLSTNGREYEEQCHGLFATRGRENEIGKGKREMSRSKF